MRRADSFAFPAYAFTSASHEGHAMTDFTPGDIVRLKSGGPKMTVLDAQAKALRCKWFDRNGKLHTDSFDAAIVELFIARPREESPE